MCFWQCDPIRRDGDMSRFASQHLNIHRIRSEQTKLSTCYGKLEASNSDPIYPDLSLNRSIQHAACRNVCCHAMLGNSCASFLSTKPVRSVCCMSPSFGIETLPARLPTYLPTLHQKRKKKPPQNPAVERSNVLERILWIGRCALGERGQRGRKRNLLFLIKGLKQTVSKYLGS